jgi:hypothetical protein
MTTITLRRLRRELASKVEQLEARAAELERDARCSTGAELTPERPSSSRAALGLALRIVRKINRAVGALLIRFNQVARNPELATAIRVTWAGLNDVAMCLSLACAVLLVSALALALVAPPF